MTSEQWPTADEVRSFHQDGFVKISGVFPAEQAELLRGALAAERTAYNAGDRDDDPRYTFARTKSVQVISNLWRIREEFADLSVHRRLGSIAGRLGGMDRIRVYHDSMLYKDTANPPVPWHQDEYFALLDKVVTAWVALSPVSREDGAVVYARGSHQEGLLDVRGMSDSDVTQHLRAKGHAFRCPDMAAGDVLFHAGTVFHRSDRNVTGVPRYAFTAFFFEDGKRLRPQPFGTELVDLVYFPGRAVGDIADSPFNPVVFGRGNP
ncbi:phytanoyl-CoA dioxygenase family protein [Streptomyces sp. NPDC091682]|uniref:phytanoyl-CoA dioxygenase family protein n=1 Tax=Streptomyces sp. NPDC091682 TaxID=3366005 RepID=UPI0037F20C93